MDEQDRKALAKDIAKAHSREQGRNSAIGCLAFVVICVVGGLALTYCGGT